MSLPPCIDDGQRCLWDDELSDCPCMDGLPDPGEPPARPVETVRISIDDYPQKGPPCTATP